jgi:hypothetical protein
MNIDQKPQMERRMKFTDDQITQLQQLVSAALAPINLQLQNGEKRMDGFARDIGELTLKQAANNTKTDAMFESFDAAQKGIKVLGWLGSIIVRGWPLWVAVAGYFGWKFGKTQ